MNGEGSIDVVSDVLNQPDVQSDYPMDFTGYNFPGPVFSIETAAYTPPPAVAEDFSSYQERTRGEFQGMIPAPLMQEPSSINQMVNFFGKVLDVAGKTYQQVATQKEVQNLKSTPYVTSALNTLGYPTVRKAQSGIDTGLLATSLSPVKQALSSISSMSPMILISGVGILLFIVMRKK